MGHGSCIMGHGSVFCIGQWVRGHSLCPIAFSAHWDVLLLSHLYRHWDSEVGGAKLRGSEDYSPPVVSSSGVVMGGEGADRTGRQSPKDGKYAYDKGTSGISRILEATKLQSVPGADNQHYAAGVQMCTFAVQVDLYRYLVRVYWECIRGLNRHHLRNFDTWCNFFTDMQIND